MQSFTNNNSSISIFNCIFENITGNIYNDEIHSALCLITSNKGGSITISDTQFINCKSDNLDHASTPGGALYIRTSGDQRSSVILQNLIFSKCNSFDGAAFSIISKCPINYTEISCRNINVTDFINLPEGEYFDQPRNIVNIQNCLINQFANILFEKMNNQKFLMTILYFSNCDGIVSSLQFKDIEYKDQFPIIEVVQNDEYSHTLIFDGLGFQSVKGTVPISLTNKNNDNSSDLTVIIDNFYYPEANYSKFSGNVLTSISIIHTEIDGMNIITPLPTVSESPTPSASDSPYPSVTETPTPSVSETPLATLSETPTPSPIETPIATPSDSPSVSATASPSRTPPATQTVSASATQTRDPLTDEFNPPINDRSVSGKADVGLIVGCTIAGIILLIAIVLIILFFCIKKVPCCRCCEETAFQPSDEESKTELFFFNEKLNQVN